MSKTYESGFYWVIMEPLVNTDVNMAQLCTSTFAYSNTTYASEVWYIYKEGRVYIHKNPRHGLEFLVVSDRIVFEPKQGKD